jgi:hypothetical protein
MREMKICELCGAATNNTHKHHVVPPSRGDGKEETLECCFMCKDILYLVYSKKELSELSVGALKASQKMQRYLKWRQTWRVNQR